MFLKVNHLMLDKMIPSAEMNASFYVSVFLWQSKAKIP